MKAAAPPGMQVVQQQIEVELADVKKIQKGKTIKPLHSQINFSLIFKIINMALTNINSVPFFYPFIRSYKTVFCEAKFS